MNNFVRYWMPVLLLCAAIFIQSAFPSPDVLPRFAWSDKFLHVVVYAVLGALCCRAFNSLECINAHLYLVFLAGVAAATLFGLSDEWHQSFVAGRSAEWTDALADWIGSLIGGTLYLFKVLRMDCGH